MPHRFMALAFGDGNDGAAVAEGAPGLGSWATWTQDDGPQVSDGVNYTEATKAVLRRQHAGVKRPPAELAWPASVLQQPGHRTGAELAQRALAQRAEGKMRNLLPELNPADHPDIFFRQRKGGTGRSQAPAARLSQTDAASAARGDTAGVSACISAVLEEWNDRWRFGKDSATRKLGGAP